MLGERTLQGWQVKLITRDPARYFGAAFLLLWVCGWAVGECFALWILIKGAIALLTGEPPDPGREPLSVAPAILVGVFLLVWLTFWTLGGILAIQELLRLLWGEDRLVVSGGRLTVTCSRGPLRTTRSFEREAIRRVLLLAPRDWLALETDTQRVALSRLGTRGERAQVADELRTELALRESQDARPIFPERWEEIVTPEGERALIQTGAVWLSRGRSEWRIDRGRLTLRRRFGANVKDVFEARRLSLESLTDSDGDVAYTLYALGDAEDPSPRHAKAWRPSRPKNSRAITRVVNDASTVRDLAGWLARETGLALEDRTTPQARAAELAQLRDLLEHSGPMGRWAARRLDSWSGRFSSSDG